MMHDELGHFGHARGYAVLRQRLYWPHMSADLTDWLRRCEHCIKRKSPTSTAPLVRISTTQPLELVCIDFLSLETSKGGFECILVITDHFTRNACAFPTRNMTAKTTADILFNKFIIHYVYLNVNLLHIRVISECHHALAVEMSNMNNSDLCMFLLYAFHSPNIIREWDMVYVNICKFIIAIYDHKVSLILS